MTRGPEGKNIPNGRLFPWDKKTYISFSQSRILEGRIKEGIKEQKNKHTSHIHSRTMYEVVFL